MPLQIPAETPAIPVVDLQHIIENPHPVLAGLRKSHPVVCFGDGKYLVLRAADIMAVLSDPRAMAVPGASFAAMHEIPEGYVTRLLTDALLLDNDDPHRAKRGLFARSFAFRSVREKRPEIRAVAERLVEQLPRGYLFDFVEEMAARLPAEMIAAILGLPDTEIRFFTQRVYMVARIFTSIYPIDSHDEIEEATEDLFAYVKAHLSRRLHDPCDDLLSALVAEWRATNLISFDSLVHQVMMLILAGSDTTRAAFAMLVALLVRHETQWDAVRADPALIPGAVMEALRFEPSVGSMPRILKEPMRVGGVDLPAGSFLSMQNLSAMRDPAQYEDPDRFDITRTDHPRLHLVFGGGAHRCIGEMLARIEMEEGLAALSAAVPRLHMPDMPVMSGMGGIRQISPMPVYVPGDIG